jgi:hypothetical protein
MKDSPVNTQKYNEDADIDKILSEGGVLAKIYLEVQGTDLEAAKLALENTVQTRLTKEETLTVLQIQMYDILKDETAEFFSGVAEIELIADDFRSFIKTILSYGPAAVEIVEPTEVKLTADMMHAVVADIADFTHLYSQHIINMLKDPERKALYEKMMADK